MFGLFMSYNAQLQAAQMQHMMRAHTRHRHIPLTRTRRPD